MILFKAIVEGRPGIKKNGKSVFVKNGRAIITTSRNYKDFEKQATLCLLQQKARTLLDLPFRFPLNVCFKFYCPSHQYEFDLSNAVQGLEDILQKIGIIEDDKLIYSLDGSRKIFGADRFYTEIEITAHDLGPLKLT